MKKLRRRDSGSDSKKSGKTDRSRSSSGSPKKKAYVFATLAAIGVLYFLTLDPNTINDTKMTAKPPTEAAPSAKAPSTPVEVLPEVSEPKQSPETLRRLRDRAFNDRELGIKGLKVAVNDGVLTIPLNFTAEKQWCRGGDLDTVKFMTQDMMKDDFLISIESLTGKTRGDRIRVSANTLYSGVARDFKIPLKNNPESLGLFICKDAEKKNTCRGKELKSHGELSNLFASSKTKDAAAAKDFQIYFQNFVVKDGELLTYDNSNITQEHTGKLKGQLSKEYNLSGKDFNAALEINKVLRSVPAKIEGKTIMLSLPYNDPRCDGRTSPDSVQ